MKVYLVGGAVRDKLLNLPVKDQDWVVTGSTPQAMLDQGYLQVGKDFPVFLHPESKHEYALARTERKIQKGYHGFECFASPEVTLEQDLQRRDLTINAMAEDSQGNLIDPYNGKADLEKGVLRHVSTAFAEDPVRILRIARLAARFAQQKFYVAHSTNKLMRQMVGAGEVDSLVAERVWAETFKALSETDPLRYFQVLRGCGALAIVFPEIENLFPVQTKAVAHNTDVTQPDIFPIFTRALQTHASDYKEPSLRFALLMMGVYRHDSNTDDIESLCKRLRVPSEFRDLAITATRMHSKIISATTLDANTITDLFEVCDGLRKPERFKSALLVCEALPDIAPISSSLAILPDLLDQCLAINARDIDTEGLKGKEIGLAIHKARVALIQKHL